MSTTSSPELPGSVLTETEYKAVIGRFPTGVTVLTTYQDGRCSGVTVSAFMSLSLTPALVAVGLHRDSRFLQSLRPGHPIGVNVLGAPQWDVAIFFANPARPRTIAPGGCPGWSEGRAGKAPVLDGAVASIECEVNDFVLAGDHVLLILRVFGVATVNSGPPLVHFRGQPHTVGPSNTSCQGDAT